MDLHQLAQLVKKMRDHQGQYFRTRTTTNLEKAFDAEKKVDEAVDVILNGTLFEEPEAGK